MASGALCRLVAALLVPAALAWRPPCVRAEDASAERELGRRFAFAAVPRLPLLRDPELVGYVRRVGGRIVGALGEQPFAYEFFVVRDARINAFAVPGGYVYVNSGLLALIESDDELAGVLGHEVAHVHAHHLLRHQNETRWLDYAQLVGLLASIVEPAVGAAATGAAVAAQLHYRREFEIEADDLGARFVKQAGFDTRGMLDFFEKMSALESSSSAGVPPYLLTHPLGEDRVRRLDFALGSASIRTPRAEPSPEVARVHLLARVRGEPAHEVVERYRAAVRRRPDSAEARYQLGCVLLEVGSAEAARQALEQAQGMGGPASERELGRAHLRLRRPDLARKMLARAVAADPRDATAQVEYGRALEESEDRTGAIAAYRAAIAAYPELEDAHRQLGLLLGRAGVLGEGHFHLGKAQLLRGEYAQALGQFEKAEAQLSPGDELVELKGVLPQLVEYVRD